MDLPISLNSALVLTTASLLAWLWVREKLSYWSKRGVPFVSPWRCLVATLAFTIKRKPFYEIFLEQYEALRGHPYGGTYQLLNPAVILRDPAMIKEWLVKGFNNFHDRGPEPDEKVDKLSGNLFQLTGEKWRVVRQKLAPVFSSAKLRIMFHTLKGCAEELSAHLRSRCGARGETELDIKDLVANYTMDVIGAAAMGVQCNAIRDPENCTMKEVAQRMFRSDFRFAFFQFLEMVHPKLPRLLGLTPRDRMVQDFLGQVTKDAMAMKQQDAHGDRKDFLQLLMKYSQEEDGDAQDSIITEGVIMGVIASFLSAGLEPVSATVTFAAYELAHNPWVQEKLFNEIQAVKKESGGDIQFDDLKKLHYLDQIVNAQRLALMDVKTMLVTLVSDYTLHPCANTVKRFKMDVHYFTLSPDGEVRLRLKKRN
nr:PREDICTED: cytochrome P450 6a2-like isoform X2 [Bemisia tabaci]